jgi:hypothetical protein
VSLTVDVYVPVDGDKLLAITVLGMQFEPEQPRIFCEATSGLPSASVPFDGDVQFNDVAPFQEIALPLLSTAMQKVVDGHEME